MGCWFLSDVFCISYILFSCHNYSVWIFLLVRNSTSHKYSETVKAPPSIIYYFIISVISENILDDKSVA